MDILSPLILLHQNGYKAFAEIAGGGDLGLPTVEAQGKILRLAEGDIHEAGGAAQLRLEPAVQTTLRNQNQAEQQMAQKVIDVAGTSKESFAKAADNSVAEAAKTVRGMKQARVAEFEMELDCQNIAQHRSTTTIYFNLEQSSSLQWEADMHFLALHIRLCRSALYGDRQPPIGVIASHFLSRDVVGMHNGPRTWIAVAVQNHTGLRLQGSVEPCQCMRCVSSQFDLDDMTHCAPPESGPLGKQDPDQDCRVSFRPAGDRESQRCGSVDSRLHARGDVALNLDVRLINFEQSASPLALNTYKR